MPPRKKQRQEANKKQLLQLVDLVQQADKLSMFREAVSPVEAPDYYAIIKHPIDLSAIRSRINSGKYATSDEAVSDINLMLSNALEYNERDDMWYTNARTVRKKLPALLRQCGVEVEQASDSDDEFVPNGREDDNEKTLEREEKRRREDISQTLKLMNDDLNVPLEVLRARYQQGANPIRGDGEAYSEGSSGTSTSESTTSDSDGDDEDEESRGSGSGSSSS